MSHLRNPRRHAFTLLEVIIALTLVSALMLVLWSLFGTFTRLQERSQSAAVELQLVRSLSRQLRTDLSHFATAAKTPHATELSVAAGANSKADGESDGTSVDAPTVAEASDPETGAEPGAETDAGQSGGGSDDSVSGNSGSSSSASSNSVSGNSGSSNSGRAAQGTRSENAEGASTGRRFSEQGIRQTGNTAPMSAEATQQLRERLENRPQMFQAKLSSPAYLRGTATRLEIVCRRPQTVDLPADRRQLATDARFGTYMQIVYDFRDPGDLRSQLGRDPQLQRLQSGGGLGELVAGDPNSMLGDDQQGTPLGSQPGVGGQPGQVPGQFGDQVPGQQAVIGGQPPPPQPLDPNRDVGLSREVKSWLAVSRDRARHQMFQQAADAGLLQGGQLPPTRQTAADGLASDAATGFERRRELNAIGVDRADRSGDTQYSDGNVAQSLTVMPPWQPPPELQGRKEWLPEVTRCQFRYFDGSQWLLDWFDTRRLPVAVEIAFDVDGDAPRRRAKAFELARQAVLGGAAVDEVAPETQLEDDALDPLADSLNEVSGLDLLEDPTAIRTAFRFVFALRGTHGVGGRSRRGGLSGGLSGGTLNAGSSDAETPASFDTTAQPFGGSSTSRGLSPSRAGGQFE